MKKETAECQDEGCEFYGKAVKCEPHDGGCKATLGNPTELEKQTADALIKRLQVRRNYEAKS